MLKHGLVVKIVALLRLGGVNEKTGSCPESYYGTDNGESYSAITVEQGLLQ